MDNLLDNALNNITDFVAIVDINFIYTYINKSYDKEFTKLYEKSVHVGDDVSNVLIDFPIEQNKLTSLWTRALSGDIFSITEKFKTELYKISYTNVKNENNEIIGAMSISKNITIDDYNNKQLERILKNKTDFANKFNHEIKTPINLVTGFSQLLQLTTNNQNIARYSKNIFKSSSHILNLMNNTSFFDQLKNNNVLFIPENVDINSIIRETINDFTEISTKNNVNITVDCDIANEMFIISDCRYVKQILSILLSNAIKYNKYNGIVTIKKLIKNNVVTVFIINTGKGIHPDKINSIYEPFNKLQPGKTDGTGLSLAIVKNMCSCMNIELNNSSIVDIGSTFSVGFNMSTLYETTIHNSYAANILCFHNDNFTSHILNQLLNLYVPDSHVIIDNTSSNNIESIQLINPNIVFINSNMSKIVNLIKTNSETSNIKIVVILENADDNIYAICENLGVYYMTKPIVMKSIIDIIHVIT
jgi:signal transduction histidine kinase